MEQHIRPRPRLGEYVALAVLALGILVAILPLILLPEGSGPVGFAMLLGQGIVVLVGLGVAAAGGYSYWTGEVRPALIGGLVVVGLGIVGGIGAYVETTGDPLVPIWAWLLAIALVVVAAGVAADRIDGHLR